MHYATRLHAKLWFNKPQKLSVWSYWDRLKHTARVDWPNRSSIMKKSFQILSFREQALSTCGTSICDKNWLACAQKHCLTWREAWVQQGLHSKEFYRTKHFAPSCHNPQGVPDLVEQGPKRADEFHHPGICKVIESKAWGSSWALTISIGTCTRRNLDGFEHTTVTYVESINWGFPEAWGCQVLKNLKSCFCNQNVRERAPKNEQEHKTQHIHAERLWKRCLNSIFFPECSKPHHPNGSGDSANPKYSQQPHVGEHIGIVFTGLQWQARCGGAIEVQ